MHPGGWYSYRDHHQHTEDTQIVFVYIYIKGLAAAAGIGVGFDISSECFTVLTWPCVYCYVVFVGL